MGTDVNIGGARHDRQLLPESQEDDLLGFHQGEDPITKKRKAPAENNPEEGILCIIVRMDKKPIAFNFFNNNKQSWKVLSCLNEATLQRNGKGTVLKAFVHSSSEKEYSETTKFFEYNSIKYEAYSPKILSKHQGELLFDLRDLEDKGELLKLEESSLKNLLKSSGPNNKIISTSKLYPRAPITNPNEFENYTSMRIMVEFSQRIPDRVYFNHVSIPVLPYVQPPKRCFICQRYGHASISCKRKIACSICSENHFHTECEVSDPNLYKCVSCGGKHKASSATCNFFKQARKISCSLQNECINHLQASISYAKLYDSSDPTLKGPPRKIIISSQNLDPTSSQQSTSHQQSSSSRPSSSASFISCMSSSSTNNARSQTSQAKRGPLSNLSSQTLSALKPLSPNVACSQTSLITESQDQAQFESEFPPAQRSRTVKQKSKIPFHKTKTYANIINGSQWYSGESSSSEEDVDLNLPFCTPATPNQTPVNQREGEPGQSSEMPENQGMSNIIMRYVEKIIKWIIDQISLYLKKSPLNNVAQNFFNMFLGNNMN